MYVRVSECAAAGPAAREGGRDPGGRTDGLCMFVCVCVQRERERERDGDCVWAQLPDPRHVSMGALFDGIRNIVFNKLSDETWTRSACYIYVYRVPGKDQASPLR